MIVKDRGLLRRLVKLVPLEKKLSTIRKRIVIAQATEAGGCTKWSLNEKEKVAHRKMDYKRLQVDELAAKDLNPMGAFVTFERERAKHVAMELWKPGGVFGCCKRHPKYARFNELASGGDEESDKRLTAYVAPRPQNVRYENLSTKFAASTKLRRCCSSAILVFILLVSVAMAVGAVVVKSISKELATELFQKTGVLESLQTADVNTVAGGVNVSLNATGSVATGLECTSDQRATLAAFGSRLSEDILGEATLLLDEIRGKSAPTESLKLMVALLSCQLVPLINGLVTVVIVVLNLCITGTIHALVEFCRYDSLTTLNTAIVTRLAIVQVLNTGVTALIVNQATGPSLPPSLGIKQPIPDWCWHPSWTEFLTSPKDSPTFSCFFGEKGIFLKGEHFDIGPRWYMDVGASLCLTFIIIALTRPAPIVLSTLKYWLMKAFTSGGVRHVELMKALYVGPIPRLPFLLGKMIAFSALCIMFSTLLPMLHVLLFLYLVSSYCWDKWYLLRICRLPTPYDASFVHKTLGWVQWVLVLKLALGYWGFASLPGISLNQVIRGVSSTFRDVAGGRANGVNRSSAAILQSLSGNIWVERTLTLGSLLMAIGVALLILMIILSLLGGAVWEAAKNTWVNIRIGDKNEGHLWPAEYPSFSDVLRGEGISSRVRILKKANLAKGQREVLALESDVDGRSCTSCMNPVQALLWLFGIQITRPKIKTLEDFHALEERTNAIIGSQNMSYAPHFMPDYKAAFAFTEDEGHDSAAAKIDPHHKRGVSLVMESVPAAKPKAHTSADEDEAAQSAI